jgi:putative two-component system response regulator
MTNAQASILIVDDTPENIDVLKGILIHDYALKVATNGELALKIASLHQPDLILLDIMMPGIDGYEVCRRLKADEQTAKIPVIFVTAMTETGNEKKGFELGAVDYLTKPINPVITRARVRTQLELADRHKACEKIVQQRTAELEESQLSAITMLGQAGHYNDTDTGVHIWRMAAYAGAIAKALNWTVDEVERLTLAAPMHDMGKIGIPDEILKAPRKLTAEEWEIMKTHSELGHKIMSKSQSPLFILAAEIALYHHEKWNGSGYPRGLSGEEIPISARIVAIADVFDALTMRRPYKEPWPVSEAMQLIQKESGLHFDPHLVDIFSNIEETIIALKQKWDEKEDAE